MSFDDDIPPAGPAAERPQERAEDRVEAETARHLAALEKLRDMGMDVAVAMKTRAIYAAAEGKTDDKAVKGFALIAKTVQQVILLYQETAGLRDKRRTDRLTRRKIQAKQIVRRAIEREKVPGAVRTPPLTEREKHVQRVRLDELFNEFGADIFEGRSVAEVVERACKLFGVEPDPTLIWPDWAELRGESQPEPLAEGPDKAAKARPVIPARFSGASAIGLNGRHPPTTPAFAKERGPP